MLFGLHSGAFHDRPSLDDGEHEEATPPGASRVERPPFHDGIGVP